MEIHPSVPAKTVPEFIAYAKANPGKINMASSGNATPLHVAGELFKMMAGVELVHVPYRGEPVARPDLLSGQVQIMFGVVPSSLPYIKNGQMRALAVSTEQRLDVLPDVPADGGISAGLRGERLVRHRRAEGHAGRDRRAAQQRRSTRASPMPSARQRLADLGCLVYPGTPADYGEIRRRRDRQVGAR